MKKLTIVVAAALSKDPQHVGHVVIGKGNALPWDRIPEDMKHFRTVTTGHAVIMGRKTFESIGKPLPKRRNIVLTRELTPSVMGLANEDVTFVFSFEDALAAAYETDDNPRVIGGAEIYRLALPHATDSIATKIDWQVDGDVIFPSPFSDYEDEHFMDWKLVEERKGETPGVSFVTMTRALPGKDD